MKKTIEELRKLQDETKGASDWYRLEEEIQELLDEEEVEPCYQGRFWDHTKKDFVSWSELIKKDDG